MLIPVRGDTWPSNFVPGLFHRIINQFGLEGTFKDHLVQPPRHGQGHLSLHQVGKNPIQPELEHFQW